PRRNLLHRVLVDAQGVRDRIGEELVPAHDQGPCRFRHAPPPLPSTERPSPTARGLLFTLCSHRHSSHAACRMRTRPVVFGGRAVRTVPPLNNRRPGRAPPAAPTGECPTWPRSCRPRPPAPVTRAGPRHPPR